MGKNQHSKDLLHLRPTEWAQDGRGFKDKGRSPFARLPLHCCFLSLQPFDNPVGTRDGAIFEVAHIIAYIKRFGVNPVTGGKLEVSELVPLQFHRNGEGKLHCPVTYKVFTNHSHVVANLASGHVYSFDAVEQLNRKNKNFTDLISSKPFKWSDIVTIQDPDDTTSREVDKFYFMQSGQQDEVVKTITHRESEASKEAKKQKLRKNAALERIFEEKQRLADEKEQQEGGEKETAGPEAEKGDGESQAVRRVHERYTSGEVAESFTSTATPLRTQNELRRQTEEEDLQDLYDTVRKKKLKGYVRIVTSEGMLNVELHTDIVPRTTDNFLRLCEKDYYENTPFHRLIRNFMMQGGDPTGTGKGGESGFEGGRAFRDEFDSRLMHQGPGVVSMANNGKNTNRSQFFVSLKSCQHLDNRHSVFGRVVGGLQLLEVLNNWETDDKDKPKKEIKLIRTEVFKNPFKEVKAEAAKPKVEEKVVDPVAQWFSNRRDPMEAHRNRNSSAVGKYLDEAGVRAAEKKKLEQQELPEEELEYANVTQKVKKPRTNFNFANW
eukprot:CAMPEP_0204566682 /NCGR_PEP_ID=MMETSP0661-20131031/36180_1 /ASSEMBLY_ACC=CAM_ASM_000606 /TAXON_ID=109239 /ORGANISM="Alexandrium margalefi, Strain AMGDE01CS-322" /LENGTH=548 /DNA_ID=CAMNT_0051574543 /DNA_START=61 /DNA_END=1707 /DNA_ORIENTATION=+